jgi:hypothetical protein
MKIRFSRFCSAKIFALYNTLIVQYITILHFLKTCSDNLAQMDTIFHSPQIAVGLVALNKFSCMRVV